MCYITDKMIYQVQNRLFGLNIFLSADMTKSTSYYGAAVKAVFFFSLRKMRQFFLFVGINIWLKIAKKILLRHN